LIASHTFWLISFPESFSISSKPSIKNLYVDVGGCITGGTKKADCAGS